MAETRSDSLSRMWATLSRTEVPSAKVARTDSTGSMSGTLVQSTSNGASVIPSCRTRTGP